VADGRAGAPGTATATAASSGNPLAAPQRRFAAFVWGVLVYNVAVILWGALVRATGSGAGCGGHWPLCNGEALPKISQIATVIEFTHRVMSGIALIAVVAMFVWARRAFPRRHTVVGWLGAGVHPHRGPARSIFGSPGPRCAQ